MEAGESCNNSVVLYPSPGMGHLVSMFELGKLFVRHGLSVTILLVEPHYNTGSTGPFISSVASANPSISFHRLPPPSSLPNNTSPHLEVQTLDLIRLTNPSLLTFLRSTPTKALVLDFFCINALDVAKELGIPCHVFYTSSASGLAVLLHLPVLFKSSSTTFRERGSAILHVPGVPPLPASNLPLTLRNREDEDFKAFICIAERFPYCDGILVNSFQALEPRALQALTAGESTPVGVPTPPVYCIGPLITENQDKGCGDACIAWLNTQPKGSVVFLCFGSLGLFSAEQLKEIAVGLEKSRQRFLWVVRSPPTGSQMVAPPEPDLSVLLPEGFLERTKERGLVVKSWAPQVEVLRHESVGGFVTHCGWNSVLEALCAGVPMIGWPLYAEQTLNIVFLVEEMRLAVEMRGYDKGVVSSEEVETRVGWLMESDEGKELRARTQAAKENALAALKESGSSRLELAQLVARLRGDPNIDVN